MSAPDFSPWLELGAYSLDAAAKSAALSAALRELTQWHADQCPEYARILALQGMKDASAGGLEDIPFLPVRLFKEFDLLSVERSQVFKTMTSSGTSGQQVSRIYLDKETAAWQTRILTRLMGTVLGKKRLPMLVIDSPSVLRDRAAFSARGAGILGFSMFGQDVTYALNEKMELDLDLVQAFLERHAGKPVFIFGFTFMIWQHLVLPLRKMNKRLAISGGIVLHGGGWKKLQDLVVGNEDFRRALQECAGVEQVVNYYGMVEQTGSIFLECGHGHLHASIYSDVLIRRPGDFSLASTGEEGLIEVLSLAPRSYPGHALLTEDLGAVLGEDDCPCGRLGKYFRVAGRVARAEARGCSDTYAYEAHV
ncbi:hypothetical protein JW897_03600 [Chromobacterium alkanivorans]|uniref:LuxE/PaaK family acyltransferase n=1 Tax=Chromobacterium alkanivorans TaxID=1071719 RepID=UPI001967C598|nr:hypothetical protein [Chromobacterium alkanivorans]MBN3002812.1 hypothetical protein [Chromobacterium alkanivorans]